MSWLTSILTLAKQRVELWRTLTQAIDESFEERFKEVDAELQQRRLLMTMTSRQVAEQQTELGKFFSVIDVPDDQKGIALLQRLDDINLKGTSFPIKDMIRRNFDGLTMDWSPVYAHMDLETNPYGSVFISGLEYERLLDSEKLNWFMTNRGRMTLTLGSYMPSEDAINEMQNTIKDTIVPLVPIDVVFDGFYTRVLIEATFNIHLFAQFTNPITDSFGGINTTHSISSYTEQSIDLFIIKPDRYSLDAETQSIRLPYQSRPTLLLDEIPLDFFPISMPHNEPEPDPMMGASIALNNWKEVSATIVHKPQTMELLPSSGYVWHAISCQIGQRYAVMTSKLNDNASLLLACESNLPSARIKTITDEGTFIGEAGSVFEATSVTMYLVIKADPMSQSIFRKINLYKLNEK